MIRLWIGAALLAGSWMLGLDYFYAANPWAWSLVVAAAVVLLGRAADKPLAASHSFIAMVLFLPAVWFAPWPYRAGPLLIVLGLALQLLPIRKRWSGWLSQGAITSGVILLVQALALELYAGHTMRWHDLPWPLPDVLAGIATLFGADATTDGSAIVMHSMRQVHRLAATWELLLDPATFLFFIGGLTMLAMGCGAGVSLGATGCLSASAEGTGRQAARGTPTPQQRWQAWIRGFRTLTVVILAWLPLRAGLLMAVYLHRVLRSDPDRPLHAMNHFFSPWMLLLLLAVPVLLAWRFVKKNDECGMMNDECTDSEPIHHSSFITDHLLFSAGLIALAVALLTAAIYWSPVGERKEGRVMVVERHSKWEPTTKPYDTTWFVEPKLFDEGSGYNYARIYRYLGQFYEMSRLSDKDKIDDQTLAKCDVLVIKTPTERYSPAEVKAVVRFVEQGGGLLLIGDHTNVFRSATAMNDVTRPMGFIFRDDLLFGFDGSPYRELYVPPAVPHPIVQDMPPMDFAVSCSIDPGSSHGRAAIVNTGLWSMGPDYHSDNFHPVPQHCPEMRYGAFIQVWAARHGQGRAVAFTDSTVFSNFCVGQPGNSEVMLGMIEWLNHGNPWIDPRPWLVLLGLATLAAGLWLVRGPKIPPGGVTVADSVGATVALSPPDRQYNCQSNLSDVWLVLLAAGTLGWVAASAAVATANHWAMPTPECVRPDRRVVIDRTTSTVPLSIGPDTQGGDEGYGLLEQWIARLGCYTVRKEGPEAFSGDVLVAICPSRSVPDEFCDKLEKYVAGGGKLLVIDSPENTNSTANRLLWPFGLSVRRDRPWKGKSSTGGKLPAVDIARAWEVVGGQPVARLEALPIAATVHHGKGSVMAVAFGSLWNDTGMGEHWMLEPNATVKARYDVLFGLLGPFFDGRPLPVAPLPAAEKKNDTKDNKKDKKNDKKGPVLKESGSAEL